MAIHLTQQCPRRAVSYGRLGAERTYDLAAAPGDAARRRGYGPSSYLCALRIVPSEWMAPASAVYTHWPQSWQEASRQVTTFDFGTPGSSTITMRRRHR